jgi:hypothetical protein
LDEFLEFRRKRNGASADKEEDLPDDELKDKVLRVVQETSGAQIDVLARQGWFRCPEKAEDFKSPSGSPFEYLEGSEDECRLALEKPGVKAGEELAKIKAEVKRMKTKRSEEKIDSEPATLAQLELEQREALLNWEESVTKAVPEEVELEVERMGPDRRDRVPRTRRRRGRSPGRRRPPGSGKST